MSKKTIVALLSSCVLLLSSPCVAQSISQETPIYFGSLVVGGAGTVTIPSNSDSRSRTGAINLVNTSTVQRGRANITFTPGAQVMISFPASLVLSGPNAPVYTPVLEGGNIQTIPPSGVLTIYFGGTLTFTGISPPGSIFALIPISVSPN